MITDTRIDPPSTFAPLSPDTPPDTWIQWTVTVCYPGDPNPLFERVVQDTLSALVPPRSEEVTLEFDGTYRDAPAYLYTSGKWTAYEETFQAEHTPQFAYELALRLGIEVRE